MKVLLRKMFAVENQRDGSAEALSFKINKKEISQFDQRNERRKKSKYYGHR